MTDRWPDGTPIRRGPDPAGLWGAEPIERWVRVMAVSGGVVWDRGGVGRCAGELPISPQLVARLEAWGDWSGREEERFDALGRRWPGGRPVLYWEDHRDAPVAAFDAEGAAIAEALRAELPPDWTVVVQPLRG